MLTFVISLSSNYFNILLAIPSHACPAQIALRSLLLRDPLSWYSNLGFCLPQSGHFFLFRTEDLENPAACVKDHIRLLSLLGPSEAPTLQLPISYCHFCPGGSPFSQLPFFHEHSKYFLVPPSPLANCISSINGCEPCCGVGGIILLLVAGGAFTGVPS